MEQYGTGDQMGHGMNCMLGRQGVAAHLSCAWAIDGIVDLRRRLALGVRIRLATPQPDLSEATLA